MYLVEYHVAVHLLQVCGGQADLVAALVHKGDQAAHPVALLEQVLRMQCFITQCVKYILRWACQKADTPPLQTIAHTREGGADLEMCSFPEVRVLTIATSSP